MAYEDRTCTWDHIINNPNTPDPNNFRIRRHALQILQPIDENGELQCVRRDGQNSFPRLDYSKGFPNWWHLSHTEITVPSEHFQEGKQYDAEVHLSHFYEIEHERKMGKVAIFLESDPNRENWPFLDKLICQWREVEEKTREECGMESVPPYPGCRNPTRMANDESPTYPPTTPAPSPVVPVTSPGQTTIAPTGGTVVCSKYANHPVANLDRICGDSGCCTNPRSASTYCHTVYNFFLSDMDEVCSECCNPAKEVGPSPPTHPIYPEIDCTEVHNPYRMCKPNSCCEKGASSSSYCAGVFGTYGDDMLSICWYCCSNPIDIALDGKEPKTMSTSASLGTTLGPIIAALMSPSIVATASTSEVTIGTTASQNSPFEGLSCSELGNINGINLNRICKSGGCCDPVRSSTDQCHSAYEFFGDFMASICSNCCHPAKELAPPPPSHPIYSPIQCTLVDSPNRICKENSCCESTASTSPYCGGIYETYGDSIGSICWYCCSEPKEVDPSLIIGNVRKLTNGSSPTFTREQTHALEENELRHDILLPHGFYSRDLIMDPSNFDVNDNLEEEYIAGIEEYRDLREIEEEYAAHQGRRLNGDNYASVQYSPYQWLREVKTEYYFRYEGGQMVPPCFETVHYRVMKDPILINPVQLAELERLLAWRISPRGSSSGECQNDTAGRPRAGSDGNAVDLNRPLQDYSNIHRKVFCECNDWVSKFQEDIDWCQMGENQRWYDEPYNFDSGGTF